jgi:nitroimidazol reductase NimA-like FMN-containing flavoprotein (pyridoxamine 5'-phosphate oxidase superfamily)
MARGIIMKTAAPTIESLTREECDALLARNRIGRLAYSFHDKVDVEPIHYVYADGLLFFRTSPGAKVTTLAHHPWVAFEVDECHGLFEWRSVVVHGTVYAPHAAGAPTDRALYQRAVEHLREFIPEVLTKDDPTPLRSLIMVMHPDTVTGREARVARPLGEARRDVLK